MILPLSFLPLVGAGTGFEGVRVLFSFCRLFCFVFVEVLDVDGNDMFTLFVKNQCKLIFKLLL